MLDGVELARVRLIAGLYEASNSWISDDDIQSIAEYLGANNAQGDYEPQFDNQVAREMLRVILGRGLGGERKDSLRQRIIELQRPIQQLQTRTSQPSVDQIARDKADQNAIDIQGKQDRLPTLGNNQAWVGDPPTPTDLPSVTGAVTQQQLNAESAARRNGDTTLGQNLAAERTARQNADTMLGQAISAEEAAREAADTALGTRIDGKQATLPELTEGQIWVGDANGNPVAGAAPSGGGSS